MAGKPSFEFELKAGFPGKRIAGVDEAGRGCIAGPVVAAAVVLPHHVFTSPFSPSGPFIPSFLNDVNDSKLLSAKKRDELFDLILSFKSEGMLAGLGVATVEEIQKLNILRASHLAMARAVDGLGPLGPDFVLVDGNLIPREFAKSGFKSAALIKGDQLSVSIACASILAKVTRDRMMVAFDETYPGYGFSSHKGYGTAAHLAALGELGVTPIHRLDFAPVKEQLSLELT